MNLRLPSVSPSGEWRVTGRAVLITLVAFFGLILVANVALVDFAISTFGGVDTPSSYKAGLQFKDEEAAAAAQKALGWTVDGRVTSTGDERTLAVDVVDKSGQPVTGLDVVAHLGHPVDSRRDVEFKLYSTGHGHYVGEAAAPVGQWRLDLDLYQDGNRVYRSRNRISVQ